MWRRGSAEENPETAKARKRVSKLSTHDLLNWADAAGTGMAKAFNDYRKHGELISIIEIQQGIRALQAVADELEARHE